MSSPVRRARVMAKGERKFLRTMSSAPGVRYHGVVVQDESRAGVPVALFCELSDVLRRSPVLLVTCKYCKVTLRKTCSHLVSCIVRSNVAITFYRVQNKNRCKRR